MLNDVLNENGSAGRSAASMSADEDDYVAPVAPKSVGASKPAPEPKVAKNTVADDDEDVMSYFQKIANEG
jgi:hypothetical protein